MQRLDLLVTRHFPRQAGKMRFAFGEQPWPTTDAKRDACYQRLSAKIDNMLVSLMRIAPKCGFFITVIALASMYPRDQNCGAFGGSLAESMPSHNELSAVKLPCASSFTVQIVS